MVKATGHARHSVNRITSRKHKTLVILSVNPNRKPRKQNAFAAAATVFRKHGGVLRTMDAIRLGVHPRTLYAATWHGVYKSTDAAGSWQANPRGLYDVDVTALALDENNPEILYAGTNPRGVYRSADGGISWTRGANVLGEYILSIAVDPANPGHIYAGTKAGVWRSTDRGDTFEPAGLA